MPSRCKGTPKLAHTLKSMAALLSLVHYNTLTFNTGVLVVNVFGLIIGCAGSPGKKT